MKNSEPMRWFAPVWKRILATQGFFAYARNNIYRVIKKIAYWTTVFGVGFALAGAIMAYHGVPILQAPPSQPAIAENEVAFSIARTTDEELGAKADAAEKKASEASVGGIGRTIVQILMNLLYYMMIVPIGLVNALLAYILEIVITYPFGTPWQWIGTDNPNSGGFVNVSAVITGWKLVRDICNIFFSLILIIIALATVLKIEAYSWKQTLPRLILMAILINFSKTICGIFTDLATVAMATFGGSFSSSFGRGLLSAFGLPSLGNLVSTAAGGQGATIGQSDPLPGLMLAYLTAGFMQIIFFIILLVFTVLLIFRIVILWFLIVLSPIAYITRILDQTKKYSSQWWEMFGRYVVIGPLITFFLWLTLSMVSGTNADTGLNGNPVGQGFEDNLTSEINKQTTAAGYSAPPVAGDFQSATPNALANFLIASMMLMASLKLIVGMASELGSVVGTVQNAAYGMGWRMLEKSGQITGGIGMGLNSKYARQKDKDGNLIPRSMGAGIMSRIGSTMAFTGATLFQPRTFANKAVEGIQSVSQWNQDQFRSNALNFADELRDQNIIGRGDAAGGTWGAINGLTANISGVAMGMGMDNAKGVWKDYANTPGLRIKANKAWEHRGEIWGGRLGPGLSNRKKQAEIDAEKKKAEVEDLKNNKLTRGEGQDLTRRVNTGVDAKQKTEELLTDLQNLSYAPGGRSATLDLRIPEIKMIIDEQRERLDQEEKRAASLGPEGAAQLVAIQDAKRLLAAATASGSMDAAEFLQKCNGGFVDRSASPRKQSEQNADLRKRRGALKEKLTKSITGLDDSIKKELGEARKRMAKNGFRFDRDGRVSATPAPSQFVTNRQRTQADKDLLDAETKRDRLRAELGALMPGQNPETRAVWQEGDREAAKQLDGIESYRELLAYFKRAQILQDSNAQTVALKKIATNFGLPGMLKEYGGSNLEGLEGLRKDLMKIGGMSEQQSIAIMNDVAGISFDKGNNGVLGAYTFDGGRWRPSIKDKAKGIDEQLDIQKFVLSKMNVQKIVQWDKFGFGHDDANGNYHLSDFGKIQLQLYGADLASPVNWSRLSAEVKKTFSQPDVITKLREASVDANLVRKLEGYYQDVARHQNKPKRNRFMYQ